VVACVRYYSVLPRVTIARCDGGGIIMDQWKELSSGTRRGVLVS
jgi:hypothetical protein